MPPLLSPLCSTLLFALPGIYFSGRAASQRAIRDGTIADIAAPGIAIALWLLCIQFAGLLTHSFEIGLGVGTLLPALVGYLIHFSARRSRTNDAQAVDRAPTTAMFVLAAILAASLIPAAIGWCLARASRYVPAGSARRDRGESS